MGIGPNTLQKSFRLIIELGEKKKNVDGETIGELSYRIFILPIFLNCRLSY